MWFAAVLFAIILGLLAYLDTRKPKHFPPGPRWFPIIGSLLDIEKARKKTGGLVQAVTEMHRKFGPVVGLKVGRDILVMVYGPKVTKDCLSSDDMAGKPNGDFFKMRTWNKRLGLLFTDNDVWQEQRRFVLRHLKDFGFGRKNMSLMVEDEAEYLIQTIKAKMGDKRSVVLNMDGTIFGVTILNALWMMLAGERYNPDEGKMKELQEILGKLFLSADMVGAPFSQFPILRFLAPQASGYRLYVDTHNEIWAFLEQALETHKKTFDGNHLRDFMDVYLKMLQSTEKKESFCEKQLLAICLDMFMAGSETTTKTLGFAMLYLVIYPEVVRKIQEEIDQVIGKDRRPSLDDRVKMPYTECFVLEAIRMFAGRALAVPHRAVRETNLNGYVIPKDAMVITNLHGTLMNPDSTIDKPEEFRPERFIKNGKIEIDDCYIPFGFGKHRCLGESLAKTNIFLVITTFLQQFDISPVSGIKPEVRCVDGITPGPEPFDAVITLRN